MLPEQLMECPWLRGRKFVFRGIGASNGTIILAFFIAFELKVE